MAEQLSSNRSLGATMPQSQKLCRGLPAAGMQKRSWRGSEVGVQDQTPKATRRSAANVISHQPPVRKTAAPGPRRRSSAASLLLLLLLLLRLRLRLRKLVAKPAACRKLGEVHATGV